MPVGISYELIHRIVQMDFHIVEHFPKNVSQGYGAQGIPFDYGYAGCHLDLLKNIEITIRIGKISTRPKNISIVNTNLTTAGIAA